MTASVDRAAEELLGDRLHLRRARSWRSAAASTILPPSDHRRVAVRALDDVVGEVALELLHRPCELYLRPMSRLAP